MAAFNKVTFYLKHLSPGPSYSTRCEITITSCTSIAYYNTTPARGSVSQLQQEASCTSIAYYNTAPARGSLHLNCLLKTISRKREVALISQLQEETVISLITYFLSKCYLKVISSMFTSSLKPPRERIILSR